MGAQPPWPRGTGPRHKCAGNARLPAAPNRYVAAGSTAGSCLLENYSIRHSTLVLAYSPDDRAHVVYSQGFYPADYAHDVPLLLRF